MKMTEYGRDGKEVREVTLTVDVMRSATFLHLDNRQFDVSREDWDMFIADAVATREKHL